MASYQSFEKCLQCGGVMIMDFDTRTENLYGCCPRCGRHANVFRREDDGKDHPLEIDDHFGYGSVFLAFKNGMSSLSSLQEPCSESIQQEFLKAVQDPNVDTARSYMTRWDEGSKQVAAVYGTIPPLYEEWERGQKAADRKSL